MSAVIPFILERTAASTAATAILIKEQIADLKFHNELLREHNELLREHNKLLEEIKLKFTRNEQ